MDHSHCSHKPRPEQFDQWVESLPDGEATEFCRCKGVTWMLRNPLTSRPCRTCGKLRNNDMCIVTWAKPPHKRLGCRSTDSAHLQEAIYMMESGLLMFPPSERRTSPKREPSPTG